MTRSKYWSFVNAIGNCLCLTVFLTNSGRVCSGWYLDHSEKAEVDTTAYLISRGNFFGAIGTVGIISLIIFLFIERKPVC